LHEKSTLSIRRLLKGSKNVSQLKKVPSLFFGGSKRDNLLQEVGCKKTSAAEIAGETAAARGWQQDIQQLQEAGSK